MKKKKKPQKIDIFAIYPGQPPQISQSIQQTSSDLFKSTPSLNIETWEDSDIAGKSIIEGILDKIDSSDYIIADITKLNFNVIFEIGYAIGKEKRVIPIVNESLSPEIKAYSDLGIFDTIGYKKYSNSRELCSFIEAREKFLPIRVSNVSMDHSAPAYVLDTLHKTDASLRVLSRIKKSRIKFRSFDPNEIPRLSLIDAYRNVLMSAGVVVHLLSKNNSDYLHNNYRAAFLAGLSYGSDRAILLLQEGDDPVPIDYRELVSVYRHPDQINDHIAEFAPIILEKLQEANATKLIAPINLLERLDMGAPAAENEASNLQHYFLPTHQYHEARSGKIRLAVGRKGSGKTALFYTLRDEIRRNRKNVVIDLKPDGYQLKRFKDIILSYLKQGVREHATTAFWEYIFILEICYKLLEKDRVVHMRDHKIYDHYQRLSKKHGVTDKTEKEDFSERILGVVNRISEKFHATHEVLEKDNTYISVADITKLIYQLDLPSILTELTEYLQHKDEVWLMFDSIDKGWPTHGVQDDDIMILRGILDASRKIQKHFIKNGVDFHSIVFVRNDVYENLVNFTSDRGKQSKVSLDWTDVELLREFLRKRLVYKGFPADTKFDTLWPKVTISHVKGEETFDFLVSRCLMRPRNLLNLFGYAKSYAVNLGHPRIEESDLIKAAELFSVDIVNDIGLEIRDVIEEADDILYNFIGSKKSLTLKEIYNIYEDAGIDNLYWSRITELLMWFSFFGILKPREEEPTYIYDIHYDMKKLRVFSKNLKADDQSFFINKAFWPYLEIQDS